MTLSPAIYPLSSRWLVARRFFELLPAFTYQVVADVRPGLVTLSVALHGEPQGDVGDLFFRLLRALGDVLDDVPVMVARSEQHLRVVPGKILSEDFLRRAL